VSVKKWEAYEMSLYGISDRFFVSSDPFESALNSTAQDDELEREPDELLFPFSPPDLFEQFSLFLSSADTKQESLPSNDFAPFSDHALDYSVLGTCIVDNPLPFSQDEGPLQSESVQNVMQSPSTLHTKIITSQASFALKDYILSPHDHQMTPPQSIYIANGQLIGTQLRGGSLLYLLRKSVQFSTIQLSARATVFSSDQVKISPSVISFLETGNRPVSIKTAIRVAKACAQVFGLTDHTLLLPRRQTQPGALPSPVSVKGKRKRKRSSR
jgi:hypothetical protein